MTHSAQRRLWRHAKRNPCWMGYTKQLDVETNRLLHAFARFVKNSAGRCFPQQKHPGKSKSALNFKQMPTVFPQKACKFPSQIGTYRNGAQVGVSYLLRFMNVTTRIKSQPLGLGTTTCFKLTILEYSAYSCMFQALNLW